MLRFDKISDELLAAFIDGNTSPEENEFVKATMDVDESVSEAIEVVNDFRLSPEDDLNFYKDELIPDNDIILSDENEEDFLHETHFHHNEIIDDNFLTHNHMNPLFTYHGAKNASEMSAGAKAAMEVFGEPGNNDESLYLEIFQGYDSTCAIRSQQIILRDYGIDLPQEYLMELAENNGWYSDENGTPMGYVGYILETAGVSVHQKLDSTVYDLINELAQGHRVIVGVDSGELWAERNNSLIGQAKEWFEDLFNGQTGADHALIVAGVEVNPNDPSDVKVVLTDPGTGDLRIEYSLDEFMDAWEDSDCFMVATDAPAPYQYDESRGVMVPSNFATQEFIAQNTYPLSPNALYIPEGYAAAYDEGHLDFVGHDDYGHAITYDKYSEKYKQALGTNMLGESHFDKDGFVSAIKGLLGIGGDSDPAPNPNPDPAPDPNPNPDPNPEPEPDPNPIDDDDDDEDDGANEIIF